MCCRKLLAGHTACRLNGGRENSLGSKHVEQIDAHKAGTRMDDGVM